MPRFEITNEDTGVTYEIDGDRPPTQQELAALMNVAGNTSESGQQKIARPDDYNSVLEGLRTALSGATGSYFDEMKAFEQAILNRQDNEEFGSAYDRSLAKIKERQKFFEQENPNLSTGLEIAGAIIPGAAAGAKFLGGKAFQTASNAGKAGRISGVGAAEGAVYGSGAAEGGLKERAKGAAKGAGVGAVAAPLGAGAVNLAGKGLGAAGQYAGRKLFDTPEAQANRVMRQTLADEGLTVDDVVSKMRELGPQGSIADVGDSFRTQGRAAIDTQTTGKTGIRKSLEARQLGQRARIKQEIERTFGKESSKYYEALDQLIADRSAAAGPLYDQAFRQSVEMNTAIGKFIKDPELSGLYAAAVKRAKSMGESANLLQILNRLKIKIDDKISTEVRSGASGEARFWTDKKRELLGLIKEQNETYGQALKTFSDASRFKDALELGNKFLKTNPDELRIFINGLNDAELETFRLGAVKNLQTFLDSQQDNTDAVRRLLGTEQMRDRLGLIMPDPDSFLRRMLTETEFIATSRQTLGGPNTAERIAAQGRLTDQVDGGILAFVGNLDPITVVPKIAKVLSEGKASPELIEKLTGQLYQQGLSDDQIRRIFRSPLIRDTMGRVDYDRMIAPLVRGSVAPASVPLSLND